ncbi:MAG: hypothetical protein K2M76_04510 [Muribaculaceae bacterium]|nr:hypothetical protein [Muribaculaceae bacterium]
MRKLLYTVITLAIPAVAGLSGCQSYQDNRQPRISVTLNPARYKQLMRPDTAFNRFDAHFDSMPYGGVRLRIRRLITSPSREFSDLQPTQLAAALRTGHDPIDTYSDIWHLNRPIVKLRNCREYYIDSLSHSYPYLVPEAARLLYDIGHRFNDSLAARGGGDYRIKVTSVLRTSQTVRRLRRRNINSVDASTHKFGTTFDISYLKFICDSANTIPRTQYDLMALLSEILADMRDNGRCLVKHERKQGCYHITVNE